MCGICGFVGRGDIETVNSMNHVLKHRGPDVEGVWHDPEKGVYLGHTRLSIIDIEGGAQPMTDSAGNLIVIFNGEIYNHRELRRELAGMGHIFRTGHSDTEVLLNSYRAWGFNMVERLNGMWAFAMYDREKGLLFLSKDRFGEKPLYYTLQNHVFAFASELSALKKHPAIRADVSSRRLKKYFAYGYIPAPGSLYHGIYKLPAGHNLVFRINRFEASIHKYWDFVIEPFESVPADPEEEWGAQLRELLERSVKRRLMSDVPLGIFLSGGIDSSSIAAFARNHVSDGRLNTFSIGFDDDSFDESIYSQKVANLFNTDHYIASLSMTEARKLLPQVVERMDEPMGDSSILPTYMLCRETRRRVKVALGGDGGDELFAGYDPFQILRLAHLYSRIVSRPIHKGIRMLMACMPVSHRNMSLDFRIKRMLRGLSYPRFLWNSVWLGPLEPRDLDELFGEPTDLEDLYSEAIEQWEGCATRNLFDRTLQFYTKLYLQDDILFKTDRASMMHSLEVRAPFLDKDLVDFVRRIPWQYKYRNGQTKYILKKALEPVLPKEIIYRPKKGFGVPIGRWFADRAFTWKKDSILNNHLFVQRMKKEHKTLKADHRAFLWNLWLLDWMVGTEEVRPQRIPESRNHSKSINKHDACTEK